MGKPVERFADNFCALLDGLDQSIDTWTIAKLKELLPELTLGGLRKLNQIVAAMIEDYETNGDPHK